MQVAVNKVMKERGLCGGGNVIMYFLFMTVLPKDPVILLSYINTQLRDFYPNLDEG